MRKVLPFTVSGEPRRFDTGVPALHLEGGIVGPHRDGVDPRFVVGDADEVGIVWSAPTRMGTVPGRPRPLLGGEVKLIHAGLEEMDLEISPSSLSIPVPWRTRR
ncbi:MAG: hypothetical protein ACLSHC_17950 [Bilophila wadsworthia]